MDEIKVHKKITDLYDEYSLQIYKYILKMIHNVQIAEDLTHDTFLKVYRHLLNGNKITYPKTYIYRTAHNVTIDFLRKDKPFHTIKDLLWNKRVESPSAESVVEIREDSKELLNILKQLKPAYREVIILRKIEGFSIRETADILKWSEAKVRTTLSRAMKSLESKIEERGVLHEFS